MTKVTFRGEIPWAESSMLTSRVPMLLVPLTPILLPASLATAVTGEFPVTTSARVPGARVEASARMRNLAPAACAAM